MSGIALPDHIAQRKQMEDQIKLIDTTNLCNIANGIYQFLAIEDYKWSRDQLIKRKEEWQARYSHDPKRYPEPTNLEIDPNTAARLSFVYAEAFLKVQKHIAPLPTPTPQSPLATPKG